MHPLHDYVAKQIAEKLRARRVVVWYDLQGEFAAFISEVRGSTLPASDPAPLLMAGIAARLVEYTGSMFELRSLVEPFVRGDATECVLIYLPGCARDEKGSVLMELEKAGDTYSRSLKWVARQVLRQRYTDGVIDDMLAPDRVTYEDLARASSDSASVEPPSILKSIFHEVSGSDALIAAWLMSDVRDEEIAAKESTAELTKLVRSRLALELPQAGGLAKLRAITLRYVLAGEYRSDLSCPPPGCLDGIAEPANNDELAALRVMASRLRTSFPDAYAVLADRVEHELGLTELSVPPECLGSIDTFRCEERALLSYCAVRAAAHEWDQLAQIVDQRVESFWLSRDVSRRALWDAYRRMAELGKEARRVHTAVKSFSGDVGAWTSTYTGPDGWHRVDSAQRRLESWGSSLDEDIDERALGVVRQVYDDACNAMALGFTKALVGTNWSPPRTSHQTGVFSELVGSAPKPVAYILVDALRFEMGVELSERFPGTAEVSMRHALGALPSITPIGMAALQPGASGSFSVVEQGGKLGSLIDGVFLANLAARRRFASARVPQLVDFSLDEFLSLSLARLARKLEGAQVVVIRSQEIDQAGESTATRQARRVMDEVLGDIASAVQKLAKLGVEHSIVTADHGHLFFGADRDESMKVDSPGGHTVELHRRCWIGRGGATPAACTRVTAASLGYDSDLDFVFPAGIGVFKAGGDLAYYHGGATLQEIVIPVLTIRMAAPVGLKSAEGKLDVSGAPLAITNRIFTVGLRGDLFAGERLVRPLLVSGGRQVGTVGMVIGAELQEATGCVQLKPDGLVTVAFVLNDEGVSSLRVVVQDPETDAELYRSPAEIPVRLGV